MSSSKKKRGQQRKAARTLAVAATQSDDLYDLRLAVANVLSGGNVNSQAHHLTNLMQLGRTSLSQPDIDNTTSTQPSNNNSALAPTNLARLISIGDNNATILCSNTGSNILLEESGILTTALDFLYKCEYETFGNVLAVHDSVGEVLGYGGKLESPASWIRILQKAMFQQRDCALRIAMNIDPLIRCMCNDTERLFFKSNKHWREGIVEFVKLLWFMINPSGKDFK